MSFKDITYLELWRPFCSAEQNHLFNIGRGYHEEQFCEIIMNLDQWFRRRCLLKIFLIWSSGGPFVQQSRTICAFFIYFFFCYRVSRGTILWNYFEFGPVVAEEMSFKIFLYLELWQPSCSVERVHLCNFERGHHGEHSCEVIWNLD